MVVYLMTTRGSLDAQRNAAIKIKASKPWQTKVQFNTIAYSTMDNSKVKPLFTFDVIPFISCAGLPALLRSC